MTNKTDITVILDRSGSMYSIRADMEGAFNNFVEDQKKITTDEAILSLVEFNHSVNIRYQGLSLDKVPKLNLIPEGNTALFDAVGKTINNVGQRLSNLPEHQRPNKVVIVIITDGAENSSREFTHAQIKEQIQHQTNVYKWVFVFLGANLNAVDVADSIGIHRVNSMTYAANSVGTDSALRAFSENFGNYRSSGIATTLDFSVKQRGIQTQAGVDAALNSVK